MRTVAPVALVVALLAALNPSHPRPLRLASSGALHVSGAGSAVLSAGNLAPGERVAGSVTVSNPGDDPVRLSLEGSAPRGHGSLGEILDVTIEDGARRIARGTVHELAGCRDLGALAAGRARTFRFTARLPRSAGNAYAGSSVTVDERWIAGDHCGSVVARAPAPRARIALSHRHVALSRGRATVVLLCRAARCRGSVSLAGRSWRTRRIFAARSEHFDIPAGGARTIHVAAPPESRPALRRRRKAVAVAVLRGSFATKRRLITLIRMASR